ncbi:MAG TPA: thiol reductant ABC exporter subunit CydD [Actinocrinis sp.]|nr:thiol reductant ABC exporter subunit CydD [Actinocrinis sp.]
MKPVDPRLLRRARPVRTFLAALTGFGALDAILLIVQASLLADLVSRLVASPRSAAPVAPAVLGLLAASAGRAALSWGRETLAVRTSSAVKATLRADLLRHLSRGPARAADRARTGELAVLATRGVDALDGYFARYLPQLMLAAVVPALVGARILAADPISGLIIVLTVPLIPVFMILIGLMTQDHLNLRWAALERLGGHFLEVVAGLPTLVAFGRARNQTMAIRRAADAHRRATMRTLRVAFLSSLALELIAMLSVAMVAVGIGLRLADGTLDLRTGLLVLICAPEVYLPLRQVGARYHEATEGLAAADRVFTEIATAVPADGGGRPDPYGEIRLEAVSVARDGRDPASMSNVTLTLAPGKTTGLVGPSGAGKSTLLHLLLDFDRPTTGRVTVGGADLADLDPDLWRAGIAWVPQNPRLTGATVADAIRLGAPEAADADVARAAERAGIDFPLDTPLGRDATAISGGQARRVALARAVLRDAPVVLLDEPTEHLDPETERTITEALRAWLPGRTVLLVTHRPALLDLCDTTVRLPAPEATAEAAESRPVGAAAVLGPAEPHHGPAGPDPVGDPDGTGRAGRLRPRVLAAIALGSAAALCTVGLGGSAAWLIATAAGRPPLLTLQVGIAAVQAFGLGRAVLRYAERLTGHDATLRILADLRVRIYQGLVRRSPAGLSGERGGDLLTNLTADIDATQDLFLKVLLPAVSVAISSLVLILVDVVALPAAALVLAAGATVAGLLAPLLARHTARRAEQRTTTARAEMTDHTVDLLDALPDLVAYGAAEARAIQIAADDRRLAALERRGALASGLGAALIALASGATCAALAAVCVAAVRADRIGGPMAAALVLAPLALFDLLAVLPDAARALDRGLAGWDRLRRVADAPALVPTPARPQALAWTDDSVLEFDRVAAAWPGSDQRVVENVSFRLPAGRQITLTGPSGVGKSTLAALAARVLDPVSGAVRIDGTDLRRADPEQVRALVAVCDQNAHLFDTTIRENLRIGRPDAEESALWHVLELVGLDRWARALPQGLDTRVGQLGDAVSGGERQRIALARALLSPAPVLVLDEPTAHLDAVTAAVVSANLSRELHGRTVVWIRHDDDSGRARTHRRLRIGWADGREPAGSRPGRESSSAEPERTGPSRGRGRRGRRRSHRPVGPQRCPVVQPQPGHRDRPGLLPARGRQGLRRRRRDQQRRPRPDRRRARTDRRPGRRRRHRGGRCTCDLRTGRRPRAPGRAHRQHRCTRQAGHPAPGTIVDQGRDHHDRTGRRLLHPDPAAPAHQPPDQRGPLHHPPLRIRPVPRSLRRVLPRRRDRSAEGRPEPGRLIPSRHRFRVRACGAHRCTAGPTGSSRRPLRPLVRRRPATGLRRAARG